MPKKPTQVETEVPEDLVDSSETKQPQPSDEVELDATTGKPIEHSKPAEPSVSGEEFRKMQARYEYQQRQFERSQRELREEIAALRRNPQPVTSPTETPQLEGELYGMSKEELNQLGQTDWTKPVSMIAEKIAEKKAKEQIKAFYEEQAKQQQVQQRQMQTQQLLEREKNWVLEQAPSLNDETSDDFRGFYATYNRMIQEDPTLIENPRSPRIVYYEWKASNPVAQVKVDPEKERLKRVTAGIAPQGRPSPAQKTIKLTQEELDFCKEKGLSPAIYAQAKEANLKEGVSA
jgi:hypothetical protein